uniref:Uncharacterized protein n=1 Tax=Oryza meridionalis TaxID=40149 RepID=A0A0E0F7J8_9ORYZ
MDEKAPALFPHSMAAAAAAAGVFWNGLSLLHHDPPNGETKSTRNTYGFLSGGILNGARSRHGGADGDLLAAGRLFLVELEGAKVHATLGVVHRDLEPLGVVLPTEPLAVEARATTHTESGQREPLACHVNITWVGRGIPNPACEIDVT